MPLNIAYTYRTPVNINSPFATTCTAAPANALPAQASPIVTTWGNLANATVTLCVLTPAGNIPREINWRVACLRTTAIPLVNGSLSRFSLYDRLDPTDKGFLSYHMGCVFTAFLSNLLGITNFIHLKRYQLINPGAVTFNNGRRPDFISRNLTIAGATWQVWEAKGLSRKGQWARDNALLTAITQTRGVNTINGVAPNARIGCLANLNNNNNRWDIYVTDPTEAIMNAQSNDNNLDEFYLAYYEPFLQLIERSRTPLTLSYGSKTFLVTYLDSSEMYVGVDSEIYEIFKQKQQFLRQQGRLSQSIEAILRKGYKIADTDESKSVNPNGIYTQIDSSWFEQDELDEAEIESSS